MDAREIRLTDMEELRAIDRDLAAAVEQADLDAVWRVRLRLADLLDVLEGGDGSV